MTGSASTRYVIMVSGAPGAGKTTLARALASHLSLPLFSKDQLKETLIEALGGPAADLEYSRRVGGAAMELLWRLGSEAPAAVLEANFRPRSNYERERVASLGAHIVEVYCDCPPDEVRRRFASRAAAGTHAAHPLTALPADLLAEYDGPVGIGRVLRVDTTGPVDVVEVAAQIDDLFASLARENGSPAWSRWPPNER